MGVGDLGGGELAVAVAGQRQADALRLAAAVTRIESFLGDIGRPMLDRWLTAATLPGLLFVAATVCARVLGHGHAPDLPRLGAWIDDQSASMAGRPGAVVAMVAVALLAAVGAAWVASLAARLVERLWLARRHDSRPATAFAAAIERLDKRTTTYYGGLALRRAWPRVWLLLSADARTPVIASGEQFHAAAGVVGWGAAFLLLGTIWWPAAAVAAALIPIGWRRGKDAINAFCELVEASIDIRLFVMKRGAVPFRG
jgi:hypothetical protein